MAKYGKTIQLTGQKQLDLKTVPVNWEQLLNHRFNMFGQFFSA